MDYARRLKKWSLARCQNVNFVYGLFRENKNRVELIIDNNQNDLKLVLLREDYFLQIYSSGESAPLKKILELKDEIISAQRETIKALNS